MIAIEKAMNCLAADRAISFSFLATTHSFWAEKGKYRAISLIVGQSGHDS